MKIRINKDLVEFIPEHAAETAELEALWVKMGNCLGGTKRLEPIGGTPVDLLNMPAGCPFAPRCDRAMKICLSHRAKEEQINEFHIARCWQNVREAVESGAITLEQAKEAYENE